PGNYQIKTETVELELSEYAGYAGLIVANGGLEPSENSIFFKKHGFKVKITLSEEESWSALNSGKIAVSATTVDVLAAYGRQFQVVVPVQIGFSRGADGVVVRSEINRINNLKGKILATAQFTEADFFIRYLAQEAGLAVHMLPDLKTALDPGKLNLVYCADAFAAGDLFLKDIQQGGGVLAGCVTWAPKTTDVAKQSGGKARILATSANLLIVSDILIVNRNFSTQHPEKVAGLVEGLLEGNRLVRDNPPAHEELIGRVFKWDREKTKSELAKVHLSNLPENLAFFSGAIDAAGSYGGIFQSAVLAYGSDLIKDPADSDRFLDLKHLKGLEQGGAFKDQKVAIAPIRSGSVATLENNPLLSKDIRFLFAPNSASLELNNKDNLKNLEAIKQLLQVSPGSTILLRGHVDNAMVDEFRRKGGEAFVRQMALKAMELSKNRAAEIKRLLVERHQVDAARLETLGRGWEEPQGTDNEQNRRVEAQWFTIE
ncbi:MAG TPA: phosphate ABC transporter substrate-binding/OmpA family protein, partial [Candidatus Paceibacterota bacterium]|nr:phosphate ABC transporter substrate-binding/OmpA family protein [Candidatus Paceibacterota bacterium]